MYAARCTICNLLYIGESKESLATRFNKHKYDAKKRPKNCDLPGHFQLKDHDFQKNLDVAILKSGFSSDSERKRYEDKMICELGTLFPDGLNREIGNYGNEMYQFTQNILRKDI